MDVEQLRQDVAAGTVEVDRLIDLIASQQKVIASQQKLIEQLQEQIEKNPTERLDESYSEKAEDKRKAEAEGKPKQRKKPKRRSTAFLSVMMLRSIRVSASRRSAGLI